LSRPFKIAAASPVWKELACASKWQTKLRRGT
jgi:hypothetical protein